MMLPPAEQKFEVPPRRLSSAPAAAPQLAVPQALSSSQAAPPATPRGFALLRRHALLGGILLLALVLRLEGIRQPFVNFVSWRQSSTAMMAQNFAETHLNIFYPQVNWVGTDTGYQGREFQTVTYITGLLWRAFGQHEWIGRAVCIAFGVWGVFALYQVVRRTWDERRALAAAAVMAALPGAIWLDRAFLPDPAMIALVTTAVWMLLEHLRTGSRTYLALWVIVGAWGLATKPPGLIVIVPMIYAIGSAWRRRAVSNAHLARLGCAFFCMLGVTISYYAWARYLGRTYPPYHIAGEHNWVWSSDVPLSDWLAQWWFLPKTVSLFEWLFWTWPVAVIVGVGLLLPPPRPAAGGTDADVKDPASRVAGWPWLFHAWLGGCLLIYVMGAKELIFNPWNFSIFNVAAAALAGHAIVSLATWASRIRISKERRLPAAVPAVLLFGVVLAMGVERLLYHQRDKRAEQGYKLGLDLRRVTRPGDLVVTIANDIGDPVIIYYSRRRGWVFPPAGNERHDWWNTLAEDPVMIQLLEDVRLKGATHFAIVAKPNRSDAFWTTHAAFVEYLSRTSDLVIDKKHGRIYRLHPAIAPTTAPVAAAAD